MHKNIEIGKLKKAGKDDYGRVLCECGSMSFKMLYHQIGKTITVTCVDCGNNGIDLSYAEESCETARS